MTPATTVTATTRTVATEMATGTVTHCELDCWLERDGVGVGWCAEDEPCVAIGSLVEELAVGTTISANMCACVCV